MRVIKANTLRYKAFHKTLPSITRAGTSTGYGLLNGSDEEALHDFEDKRYEALVKILNYGNNLKNLGSIESMEESLRLLLNELYNCRETDIFLFTEDNASLNQVSPNIASRTKYFIENLLINGTLKEVLESGKHKIISDSLVYNIDGTKSIYFILPFTSASKYSGVLLVLMPFQLTDNSIEIPLIKICMEMFLRRLEVMEKQEELSSAYNELQVYQSKLSNDYKLSAIGELTSGIVEDVLSPLQVIISSTEFLRHEDTTADEKVLDTINLQVKKVKNVINRLVKFASTGDVKNKIYPCNLNTIINDFYIMVNSSLKNDNYECVLDLEKNIPLILTHPNYINQILTNIFFLIKAGGNKAGGIFLQTRCIKENVIVRFLSTDYFEYLQNGKLKPGQDVNFKIIHNLMLQHQGEIKFNSDKNKGTIIILSFPLKRKIVR